MTTPRSYPFLEIARFYGADYGDVLLCAQILRHGPDVSGQESDALQRIHDRHDASEIKMRIISAVREQRAIRRGQIDWQTGEPL